MGEHCDNCGGEYLTVYRLPDTIWAKITGRANGLLCPECADSLARDKGVELYWEAAVNKFPID